MSRHFTERERAILRIVQDQLPDSLAPFDDIAAECGSDADEVLALLQSLRAAGAIRRFGASLRHQRSGWTHNIMVAWQASEEEANRWAWLATRLRNVSHAYYRPSPGPVWPYSLYTMIHGRSEEECLLAVDELRQKWPFKEYIMLPTLRELKKSSMRYF